MTEFLIIGRGLAASVLMHQLHEAEISFHTIGTPSLSTSSRVAAGLWNPIVFKRMTAGWLAKELTDGVMPFYEACEIRTGKKFATERTIIRPFNEEQEERLWTKRADDSLKDFLDPVIYRDHFPKGLIINRGYGLVKRSGNLDVASFIDATEALFNDQITEAQVVYADIQQHHQSVSWKHLTAKNILFCEGHLIRHNPWFNWLPLKPAKGEIIHIACEDIDLTNQVFNKDGFILRTTDGTLKVGATYVWDDLTDTPTDPQLTELEEKVRQMTHAPYSLKAHLAGVRPSSLDRRPLIGRHPSLTNFWVFNGLGAKGVLMAPYFAKNFVHFYKQSIPLHPEVQLNRYYDRFTQTQDQTHWST
jgi:glycine/D-amino acid oxidase-like deaminating enzyme